MGEAFSEIIKEHGVDIVTFGGNIHPYLGAALAVLLSIALAYLGIRAKNNKLRKDMAKAAKDVQKQTSKDQDTANSVNNEVDNFLEKEEKNKNGQ